MTGDRRQRSARWLAGRTATVAGLAFVVAFAWMLLGSMVLHEDPTKRWFVLCAVLMFGIAPDQILNRRLHARRSRRWKPYEHGPALYVWLGVFALLWGLAVIVFTIREGIPGTWFTAHP